MATEHLIEEIKKSDLEPIVKAALISNAGKIIKEYSNQKSIVKKAIEMLDDDSKVDEIEDDWIASFMDHARMISNEEFQLIWAKLLAEEVRESGSISLRTLSVLRNMNKEEALLFQKIARNAVFCGKEAVVFSSENGLDEDISELLKLEDCGLISSQQISKTFKIESINSRILFYNDNICCVIKSNADKVDFKLGLFIFSKAGYELIKAIDIEKDNDALIGYIKKIKSQKSDAYNIYAHKVKRIEGNIIYYDTDDLLDE